jgi:DNA adenine methylase
MDAKVGDFIYFDPPYTVAHGNNGFIKYNAHIFSWRDQIRLASFAQDLAKRGCKVLVSNADHPSIRELYSSFKMQTISRTSAIAASEEYRHKVTECIFYNEE